MLIRSGVTSKSSPNDRVGLIAGCPELLVLDHLLLDPGQQVPRHLGVDVAVVCLDVRDRQVGALLDAKSAQEEVQPQQILAPWSVFRSTYGVPKAHRTFVIWRKCGTLLLCATTTGLHDKIKTRRVIDLAHTFANCITTPFIFKPVYEFADVVDELGILCLHSSVTY